MGHHQADQQTYCKSSKRRKEKEAERIFEEIMTEKMPCLMKNIHTYIQEVQKTPTKINRDPHLDTSQNRQLT